MFSVLFFQFSIYFPFSFLLIFPSFTLPSVLIFFPLQFDSCVSLFANFASFNPFFPFLQFCSPFLSSLPACPADSTEINHLATCATIGTHINIPLVLQTSECSFHMETLFTNYCLCLPFRFIGNTMMAKWSETVISGLSEIGSVPGGGGINASQLTSGITLHVV